MKKHKILIVVDVQNDFIDGALRNEDAIKTIPNIVDLVKNFDGPIIFTQDTHYENYLETLEGKNLPIKHCIEGSEGWKVNDQVLTAAMTKKDARTTFVKKKTFGSEDLPLTVISMFETNANNYDIYLCGFCTDICVVSNALLLRAGFPNNQITVFKDCCAGTSKEAHEAALTVMKSCQINIK